MKPQTVLKLEHSLLAQYTKEQVEAVRDTWISAYEEITETNCAPKELCDSLVRRIRYAASLFISHQEQDDCLDGDFPLGNEADMEFASPYFSIQELAMIQMGCAREIDPNRIPEAKDVRDGFLKELEGSFEEARWAYYAYNHLRSPEVESVDRRRAYMDDKTYAISRYEDLLAYSAQPEQLDKGLNLVCCDLCYLSGGIRKMADATKKDPLVRQCEEKMTECYQRALERDYQKIKAHKERGVADFSETDLWTLTLSKDDRPVRTTVIGVGQHGEPIFADDCRAQYFGRRRSIVEDCCADLENRIQYNDNLYALLAEALKLREQGSLGADPIPTPNYNLDGLVGGQLDAAAWQNYAIEHGMVRHVDYDASLNKLIEVLQELIELYEKALRSIE